MGKEGRIIKDNPLRILGVFSDTPKKEIIANLGKLRAFAKTGKILSFDSDFTTLLGPVSRTIETIEKANNDISLPKDKLQAGMFWFMQHTDNDKKAMDCIKSGDPNEAMFIIQRKGNYSGIVNMAVLALILKRWDIALYSYAFLLESNVRRGALVKAFTDSENYFSEDDLVEFITGKLIQDFPDAHWIEQIQHENVELGEKSYPFKSRFADSKLIEQLKEKCVYQIKNKIDSVLKNASLVSKNDAKANIDMAEQIEETCKPILKELRLALGKGNKVYIEYADNVANQILDNCIDYYNNDADNPQRARNVIKFTRFAYRTAEGKTAKERAKRNLDILNETLDNLIPQSIEEEYNAIDKLVTNYHEKNAKGSNSFLLKPIVEDAYRNVLSIKSKVGKDNKHYLAISSNFVYFASQEVLNKISADLNYKSNAERVSFIINLHWAKSIFDILAKFDKDEECLEEFNKNFTTLKEILQQMVVKPSQTSNSEWTQQKSTQTIKTRYVNTGVQPQKSKESIDYYIIFGIALVVILFMAIFLGKSNKTPKTPSQLAEELVAQEQEAKENTDTYTDLTQSQDSYYEEKETTPAIEQHESYTEPEPVHTVQYNTGDRPYQSTYGKGNYDSNTKNSLLIKNGTSTDAVVFLERLNGKKIRHVFIKRGENYTMSKIPGGQYIVKIMQGTDWNPEKDNGPNNPKGGFMYSCSISKSESYDPFNYPDPSTGRYSQGEITLYKVQNGNMQTEAINENDLF